jgi:hypothetical protein
MDVLLFIAALAVLGAGIARLRGRRSRIDRAADVLGSSAAMAVYPPSLRGGGVEIPPPPDLRGRGLMYRRRRRPPRPNDRTQG